MDCDLFLTFWRGGRPGGNLAKRSFHKVGRWGEFDAGVGKRSWSWEGVVGFEKITKVDDVPVPIA